MGYRHILGMLSRGLIVILPPCAAGRGEKVGAANPEPAIAPQSALRADSSPSGEQKSDERA